MNDSEHYRKFCSAGEKGHLGCQLWISKQSRWNLESIVVRRRDPRLICIVGKLSGVNCAAIAAHAPHSGSEDHVIDEWWGCFAAFLTVLPHSASPIICKDANARFRTRLQRDREPANHNAFHTHRILEQFHLEASAPFDNEGKQIGTHVSKQQNRRRLQFYAWPESCICELAGWNASP